MQVSKLCLIGLLALTACQGTETSSPHPDSARPGPASASPATEQAPLPGGETAQDPESPLAKSMLSAGENLLRQKYPEAGIELTGLQSFSTQVVAGTNYRLVAAYSDGQGRQGLVKLTIYRDLQDQSSLTEDDYPG